MSIRIIIAETDPHLRARLRAALQPGMEIVAEFAKLPDSQTLSACNADVICIDETLARSPRATRAFQEINALKRIVLFASASERKVNNALSAGVLGCVLKTSLSDEISRAVYAVLHGDYFSSPTINSLVVTSYKNRILKRDSAAADLPRSQNSARRPDAPDSPES